VGEPGEERAVSLELKLIADIGLVGFPNAGKSTLLSRISSARPKIADYPFTTLQPHLGIVRYDESRSFVVADIPGLIKGAHLGKGLGDRFLRHIERTRALAFLIDCTDENPGNTLEILRYELTAFNPMFSSKEYLVVLTKSDICDKALTGHAFSEDENVLAISAVTGYHIDVLLRKLYQLVIKN
jgi:GTP-binding protein